MKLQDWHRSLAAVIDDHRRAQFEWGRVDCFRFPLACVDAMTGSSIVAEVAPYDSRLSAYRELRARGWEFVGDAFADRFEEIDLPFMGRGDLAVIRDGEAICGAVCVGNMLVAMAERGLAFLPRNRALRAFKV